MAVVELKGPRRDSGAFSCAAKWLADWDRDRNTGAIRALARAIDQISVRDEFVDQLRSLCAQFEDDGIDVINVPEVPGYPRAQQIARMPSRPRIRSQRALTPRARQDG